QICCGHNRFARERMDVALKHRPRRMVDPHRAASNRIQLYRHAGREPGSFKSHVESANAGIEAEGRQLSLGETSAAPIRRVVLNAFTDRLWHSKPLTWQVENTSRT